MNGTVMTKNRELKEWLNKIAGVLVVVLALLFFSPKTTAQMPFQDAKGPFRNLKYKPK